MPLELSRKTSASKSASTAGSAASKAAQKPAAKATAGYTNPALKAMGINRIKLPSRNWTIFLSVTGIIIGGIVYDKREQKKIRQKWMDLAKEYGNAKLPTDELPRKLTIYISPPPNDYLDESLKLFRRFVKPVLNAGGVDFEFYTSDKQGRIRYKVAKDIRMMRRQIDEIETAHQKKIAERSNNGAGQNAHLNIASRSWNYVASFFTLKSTKLRIQEEQELKQSKEFEKKMKNVKNILSIYYNEKDKNTRLSSHSEDSDSHKPLNQIGGVVCFGRGIYKEYMSGLHEGLLGPLQKPARVIEQQALDKQRQLEKKREKKLNKIKNDKSASAPEVEEVKDLDLLIKEIESRGGNDESDPLDAPKTESSQQDDDDDDDIQPEVIAPYILPREYGSKGTLAEELKNYISEDQPPKKIPTEDDIPPFFQQPIAVMPVPHLLGFLKIPERIYRFYNRRYLADEYGRLAYTIVKNNNRPFDFPEDADLAIEEEKDWPEKWIKTGQNKDSDWVREFVVDKRITKNLWIYNDKREAKVEKQ